MISVLRADLNNLKHARAVMALLNDYASDIMGGGKALPPYTRQNLVEKLKKRTDCRIVLAFKEDEPAGLAICFEGFSTFMSAPILNIHDLTVAPQFRGHGLSRKLLAKVEEVALETGCCKLTLEVLEGNTIARSAYAKYGFSPYELSPEMGHALFYEKKLITD